MVSAIKAAYPGKDVIIFFDEPFLVSFGSAYVSISKDETISFLNDTIEGIDAKVGVHCCGNTDWSVLFNSEIDIVNYDAFNFLETIFYFKDDLVRFLKRGGRVSPGIVPTSEDVTNTSLEDVLSLRKRFSELMAELNIEPAIKDWLITTSCGLGSLKTSEAKKAMELLKGLSEA
jgi:methionine synthase II (cobalamin-independent)